MLLETNLSRIDYIAGSFENAGCQIDIADSVNTLSRTLNAGTTYHAILIAFDLQHRHSLTEVLSWLRQGLHPLAKGGPALIVVTPHPIDSTPIDADDVVSIASGLLPLHRSVHAMLRDRKNMRVDHIDFLDMHAPQSWTRSPSGNLPDLPPTPITSTGLGRRPSTSPPHLTHSAGLDDTVDGMAILVEIEDEIIDDGTFATSAFDASRPSTQAHISPDAIEAFIGEIPNLLILLIDSVEQHDTSLRQRTCKRMATLANAVNATAFAAQAEALALLPASVAPQTLMDLAEGLEDAYTKAFQRIVRAQR